MTLLSPTTDWTNETNETRAEECARFLATRGLITMPECRRILNGVRASADAERALEWYADTFCEYSTSNTGCGKYGSDVCSGCLARATLSKIREQREG